MDWRIKYKHLRGVTNPVTGLREGRLQAWAIGEQCQFQFLGIFKDRLEADDAFTQFLNNKAVSGY